MALNISEPDFTVLHLPFYNIWIYVAGIPVEKNFADEIFAEGIFTERNFRRKDFSPDGIFAKRNFHRTGFSPSEITRNRIFAEYYEMII